MMVGGHEESVQRLAPILDTLAPPDGWRRFGDAGAGHFVKMVHNGVEYGLMQAYAEGFDLMQQSEFPIELKEVAGLWNRGSVVRSWLCELAERAFDAGGQRPRGHQGPRVGLRRGPLDDRRRHRPRRPHAGHHRRAVRALLLARQRRLHATASSPRLRGQFGRPRDRARGGRRAEARSADRRSAARRRTRSSRGSSGSRSRARRSSSSAPPATSRGASCCPRSTTSPTRGRCPSASTSSASRAARCPTTTSATSRASRSPSSPAARRTSRCSTACSSGSPTSASTSPTRTATATLGEALDGTGGRGPPAQPRLLPLHRAGVLRDDHHARSRRRGSTTAARADVRVVIEKPFGIDLESARELQKTVAAAFREQQVFRIDHYLGKETVQNVMAFRFANYMFEPVWNRNYIDSIQITAAEDLGIGSRAGYYDRSGALRDLVQNHMLQLLTLVCMEPPRHVRGRQGARREGQGARGDHAADAGGGGLDDRARAVHGGRLGRRGGHGLPRGGRRPGRLPHRDLRRAAPGGPQLALGRRADRAAHRQAARAQGDRDRGPAQAGPAPGVPVARARSACSPTS